MSHAIIGFIFLGSIFAHPTENDSFNEKYHYNPGAFEHFKGAGIEPHIFNVSMQPFSEGFFLNLISMYQRTLTKNKCQFFPSCSRYAYLSVEKLGPSVGLSISLDRYWRCNLSAENYYDSYDDFLYDPPYGYSVIDSSEREYPLSDYDIKDKYIRWLLSNDEFDIAYEKLIVNEYNNPDLSTRRTLANISIRLGNYDRAIYWLHDDSSDQSIYLMALSKYKVGKFDPAKRDLDKLLQKPPPRDIRIAGLWIHSFLEDLASPANSTSLDIAIKDLERFENLSGLSTKLQKLRGSNASKVISTFFSGVVPGSGQIVNGFLEDGVYAFIFTTGLGLLFIRDLHSNDYISACLTGIGFSISYAANLIGAYNAPERNLKYRIDRIHFEISKVFNPDR